MAYENGKNFVKNENLEGKQNERKKKLKTVRYYEKCE